MTATPLVIEIGEDEMDLVGSVTDVAVRVTMLPPGTAAGAW